MKESGKKRVAEILGFTEIYYAVWKADLLASVFKTFPYIYVIFFG